MKFHGELTFPGLTLFEEFCKLIQCIAYFLKSDIHMHIFNENGERYLK